MMEAGMSTEKRQSPRAKTSIPVRYREFREGAEAAGVGSVTCVVSTGGVRFGAKPVQAVSEVARVAKADGGDDCQYHVGSEFMEITRKDQERIAKYLNSR